MFAVICPWVLLDFWSVCSRPRIFRTTAPNLWLHHELVHRRCRAPSCENNNKTKNSNNSQELKRRMQRQYQTSSCIYISSSTSWKNCVCPKATTDRQRHARFHLGHIPRKSQMRNNTFACFLDVPKRLRSHQPPMDETCKHYHSVIEIITRNERLCQPNTNKFDACRGTNGWMM